MDIPSNLIGSTIVPHQAWSIAVQSFTQCYEYAREVTTPQCQAVIGEPRVGKSRIIRHIRNLYPETRTEQGLIIPVLRVKTPAKPTPKGLAEAILYALHDPRYAAGSEQEKTFRIITLLNEVQTRLMFVDDFHHFYDKTTHKVQHYVSDWLKNLVDDSQVALGVAGLETSRCVIEQNEQLAGRFKAPAELKRLDWMNDDDRAELLNILDCFQKALRPYFDLPRFDTEDMGFRWYCATGGLMGYIAKVLEKLVMNAKDVARGVRKPPDGQTREVKSAKQVDGPMTLTLEHLNEAHMEAVWAPEGLAGIPSPFSASFSARPDEKLLEMVRRIGTKVEPDEAEEMRWRPIRQSKASTKRIKASTILSAKKA